MTELEKQLLAVLRECDEAMAYMSEYDIPLTLPDRVKEAIAAAEAAQAMRHHKPVATVRVTHKGYGMKLSTYVAYALPEGMHDVYAVPQPAAVPDDARECLLDVVSHHQDFAEAVQRCADIERENGDDEDVGYWKHQADVLNRMKEQAERALLASAPAPAQVEQQAREAAGNARAIEAAAAAIYFADSSDYLGALWTVLRSLSPDISALMEKDEDAAYQLAGARLAAEAQEGGEA